MCVLPAHCRRGLPNNIIRAALEMQQFLNEQKQEKIKGSAKPTSKPASTAYRLGRRHRRGEGQQICLRHLGIP